MNSFINVNMEDMIKASIKNSLIAAGAVTAMGVSGLVGVSAVSAQAGSNGAGDLADRIATKFNLNKDEVKSVFKEARKEHEAEREAERTEKLQNLVDVGKITADQKAAIEAKLKDIHDQREQDMDSMRSLTPKERKARMEAKRTELEAWAKSQGIDSTQLRGVFMGGGFEGRGHGPHFEHED